MLGPYLSPQACTPVVQGKEGHQACMDSSQLLMPVFSGVPRDAPSRMIRVDSKVQVFSPPSESTPHMFLFIISGYVVACTGAHLMLAPCSHALFTKNERVQSAFLCFGVAHKSGDSARASGKCPAAFD